MSAHRVFLGAALFVAASAGAQAPAAAGSVQMVGYTLERSGIEKRIQQLVVPVVAAMTFGERFGVDVATAYATADVEIRGAGTPRKSTISGLTDTQLRASYTFGDDFVVLTAGLNLPTGRATADSSQFVAAGQIANDFLLFPIGSFGSGLGGTAGIAVARPLGSWNLGAGASYRHSAAFEPYEYGDGSKARYEPGDEVRARLGVDRSGERGRLALGVSLSTFADDAAGGGANRVAFNTGDRLAVQGSYETALAGGRWSLGAWSLMRREGARADRSIAPRENVTSAMLGASYDVGPASLEPSFEMRLFDRAGSPATGTSAAQPAERGSMAIVGARARWSVGALQVLPSAGYSTGSIGDFDLRGLRLGLAIRHTP
ncbi:MAG TPA: hypothetical protein VHM67_02090 [Gemmatimonadaceae bacterium]|nr:hypothetical protein [Gemmatimonadaceae bacterium]